ncbi:unnamed protein product [Owenia fusiformis]|uniref:Uncharacterized protein n=1 Tax=Owenia fusiformis TaxID=6347 RepID=A0A8J1U568_OWEFU|nr:unnamed protein product [Owenia fusiformis]
MPLSDEESGDTMPIQQIRVSPIGTRDNEREPTVKMVKETEAVSIDSKNIEPKETLHANSPSPPCTNRCESRASLMSSSVDICRICHCEAVPEQPLITPCVCVGSLKFVHQACLQQWVKSADTKSCELCKFNFIMTTQIKPLKEWQKLEMTTVERRKIMCSVTFHIIAITCVIWSLYVLIDRTTEEVRSGTLEWPFWTKLIVVAIGFTGGLVFMYVQCKMYIQLCRRWRAFNRVIYIQNIPDDVLKKHQLQNKSKQLGLTTCKDVTLGSNQTELL